MRYFLVFYSYTSDFQIYTPSRKLVLCQTFPSIIKLESIVQYPLVEVKDVTTTNIIELSQEDAKSTRLIPIELTT